MREGGPREPGYRIDERIASEERRRKGRRREQHAGSAPQLFQEPLLLVQCTHDGFVDEPLVVHVIRLGQAAASIG
jgi:hypothetical protein